MPEEAKIVRLADIDPETPDFDGYAHNTMRFNVSIAHSYPMFDDGDMDKEALVKDIHDAIIAAVDKHSKWQHSHTFKHQCQGKPVRHMTDEWLHHETILYDFS